MIRCCNSPVICLRLLIIFTLITSSYKNTYATHAMGMDLTYQEVGVDSFLITLAFYRDCAGVNPQNNYSINLRSALCNEDFDINLPKIGTGTETTPVCTTLTTECSGGVFPGAEEHIYQRIVQLPAKCADWIISARICCRNNAITTIVNPGNQNIYVETQLNNNFSNSSPQFSNNPVPFVCANELFCFNNGAVDADGDSLVYSLVTPRTNRNVNDTVVFNAGYTNQAPISSTPPVSINPLTGDLCMTPTDSTEIGVLAVLVEEYRNGTKIGSIMRDIQVRILGCPSGNSLPTLSGIDSTSDYSTKICVNNNLNFNVYSADADTNQVVTMTWNQAVPGATFTVSGGSRPVGTFNWTPNQNDVRSQPYCFTVEVADNNCPFNGVQVYSYCIYVVGLVVVVDSVLDPTCPNACDGQGMVEMVNGIPPFTYQWSDPMFQTTAKATNLCAGNYFIQGTDSTGCASIVNISLTDPDEMIAVTGEVMTSCNGSADGAAYVASVTNGIPPYTYQWDANTGNQTGDTATMLSSGSYNVTVTDSIGCFIDTLVMVSETAPVQATTNTINNVSCKGLNDGTAVASATGGTPPYTYLWDAAAGNQANDTAFNLLAGTFTVIVTDANNCIGIDSITITEPGSVISLSLTTGHVDCFGDSTGWAKVVATGGTPPYNYNWDAGTGNQTADSAINLGAGIYSVTVTDLNNCSAIPNVTITQPDSALTATPVDSFVTCFGDTNGAVEVVATGGTPPYTYLWDATAGNQTTPVAVNLEGGTYQVQVTDSLNCTTDTTARVIQSDSALTIALNGVDVTCHNGSDGIVVATITGGIPPYSFSWDTLTVSFANQDSITGLQAGTYLLQVTDSLGCTADSSITLSEPPPLLTLQTGGIPVDCFGDSTGRAWVIPSGGTPPYAYQWDANTGNQTTDTAVGLISGGYQVTVFDSNYCIVSPVIIVDQPSMAMAADFRLSAVACFGDSTGTAVVIPRGGTPPYQITWDTSITNFNGDSAYQLAAGTYGVRVTDSLSCTFDTTFTVTQPTAALLPATASAPVLCFSGSDGYAVVTVTGGTTPYTILWDSNAANQTTDTAFGLTSRSYLVQVTDSLGCVATDSVQVAQPAEPLVLLGNSTPVSCFGGNDGMAAVVATGGTAPYTYLWDNAAGSQTTPMVNNLAAGTYSVMVTDTNQCDTLLTIAVTEPNALEDSIFVSSDYNGADISCFGLSDGMATVIPIGGTAPYTILWDNNAGNQTTDTASGLTQGLYTVTITDTNGCSTNDVIALTHPSEVGIDVLLQRNISCNQGQDGRIVVAGTGGTSPYRYVWATTPAVNDSTLANVGIGNYTVTVTDTNNCAEDTTLTLTEPLPLTGTLTTIDVTCNGGSDGSATSLPAGGTPPYSYLWDMGGGAFQIGQTALSLSAGSYPLTVTDSLGCVINDTAIIAEPTPVILVTSEADTICRTTSATIGAQASGGTPPYGYTWSQGLPDDTVHVVTPDSTTSYLVLANDSNNCPSNPALINVFVRNFNQDTLSVSNAGNVCAGDSTTIRGIHNGSFGPFNYTWNSGQSGLGPHAVAPTTDTTYVLTVSNICGEFIEDSTRVEVYPLANVDLPALIAQGCAPLTVQFEDTINTLPNLTYLWEFGDGTSSIEPAPTYTFQSTGDYVVSLTIRTEDGCVSDNKSSPANSLVRVLITPVADFEADPDETDLRTPTISFSNFSESGTSYSWDFGDDSTSTLFEPQHTYLDSGRYQVKLLVVSTAGCEDSTIREIIIDPYYFIEVPDAFTPDPDQENDGRYDPNALNNHIFYPHTRGVTNYEMLIFNRWGELIFESNDHSIGWNGYYRGRLVAQEVYVYKIRLQWENGQEFEKVGNVTLFR